MRIRLEFLLSKIDSLEVTSRGIKFNKNFFKIEHRKYDLALSFGAFTTEKYDETFGFMTLLVEYLCLCLCLWYIRDRVVHLYDKLGRYLT